MAAPVAEPQTVISVAPSGKTVLMAARMEGSLKAIKAAVEGQ